MLLSHLTSLCMSFWLFKNCKPSSTDATAQLTEAAEESLETNLPATSDPTSKNYLEEHGYGVWNVDRRKGGFQIYTLSHGDRIGDLVLHVNLDVKHKVTTIFKTKLEAEEPDEKNPNPKPNQIFHALYYEKNVNFNEINWIVMDVNDWRTNEAIRFYRRDNHLSRKAQIRVTPQDKGWSIFSQMNYYKTAAKMIPDKEIDKILVVRQERQTYVTDHQAEIIETLRFSFKSPSQDEETYVDPIEAHAAELAAEDNVKAAVEIAANAAVAHEKEILEDKTERLPDATLDS
ncbi:hypothetical protein CFO_g5396 [Ceratocystis platani]|uniref:Uncharacterized protein n=2 Tax=Ceratocystis TaxID=5157 RepID=A0A0F8CNE8_CERFI|nr:hypothetical protein CFO_g5396 [Ceratocystis platani]